MVKPKVKRRRGYSYKIGFYGDWNWSASRLERTLTHFGFKAKILGVELTGMLAVAEQMGLVKQSLQTLVARKYNQIIQLVVYCYPEDETYVRLLIRGCFADIIPENQEVLQR